MRNIALQSRHTHTMHSISSIVLPFSLPLTILLSLQSNTLPTELSPQYGKEPLDIQVSYISLLAHLTLKEVEVNSEYHAFRKYSFMVFFMFARDHGELF